MPKKLFLTSDKIALVRVAVILESSLPTCDIHTINLFAAVKTFNSEEKSMKRFFAFSLVAATFMFVTEAPAQSYSLTVLNDPWVGNTVLSGINDRGDIVGNVLDQDGGPMFGFLYSNNTFTKIEAPGAARTQVSGINNSGKVVGSYSNYETFREFDSFGFVYDNGSFHGVNPPNPWNAGTYATDINNSGTIAGWYDWGVEDFYGFSYDGNSYKDIYAGWETFATGITGKGEVVGFYQPEIDRNSGFIYDGTGFKDVNYPGAYDTYLSGASEAGLVVGGYTLPVYDPMYPDWMVSVTWGGDFLWDGTSFAALDIPNTADVNSSGWIVGSQLKNGSPLQFAGILAVPLDNGAYRDAKVPEPATMLLLGGAIAGIVAARRKAAV